MGLTWLQFYADPKNQLGAKDRDQNRSEAKTFPIPDHLLNGQDLRFPIEKDPSKGTANTRISIQGQKIAGQIKEEISTPGAEGAAEEVTISMDFKAATDAQNSNKEIKPQVALHLADPTKSI